MTRAGRERSGAPIVLLSDFGYHDHYVGVMKGVIASIAPAAKVIDLTHGIAPHAIAAGSIVLEQSWRHFPERTIFVAVVDPGVGTSRLPIAVECSSGARFIGPDNGLLINAAGQAGIRRMVELQSQRYRLPAVSATFHGRDIFAPAAAHLWRGVRIGSLGPELRGMTQGATVPSVIEQRNRITGSVIYVDGFGNLITNIDRACVERLADRFRGSRLSIRIGREAPTELRNSYGEAEVGDPLATFGSFEKLEVAVRNGSAAERFAAGSGAKVTVGAVRRTIDE
jgi:S-adenosyl-L-methionine hydrolase (adenosine-forming)